MSFSTSCRIRSVAVLAASVVGLTVTACSDGEATPEPLSALVIGSEDVPDGFQVMPADVGELIGGNRRTLEQAKTVEFTPAECRPTADEAFSPGLTAGNTALLVASSPAATLSELVTTVRRDVDADRRASTGPCRVVTAEPTRGTLAGARIVTSTRELPPPVSAAAEQALVVRQDSVTTLVDGKVRVRSALVATVLVRRPRGEIVTMQLSVVSANSGAHDGTPGTIEPPMDESQFLTLVDEATDRAAR
ncbi:hypothetical protein [Gordonia iterans]|uniref:hypothetical protein n=1 Tax=Gordonia iterans TaxID=1004901 RepID=UPI001F374F02|nr:hypothetical protein [Gordonia iterans]